MISMLTVLAIALVAPEAAAIALEARVTSAADSENAHNEAPAPTPGPSLAKAGLRRDNGIFRRSASSEPCGYIDRVENAALNCYPGSTCACRYHCYERLPVANAVAWQLYQMSRPFLLLHRLPCQQI